MIAEYKIQKKKNDDPEQLPEPVERKQQLSAERVNSYDYNFDNPCIPCLQNNLDLIIQFKTSLLNNFYRC